MELLGPLKFYPLFKEKIWGGEKIKTILGKDFFPLPNCGELWAISGLKNNESIVSEGPLKGNNLNELLEIYMEELVGEAVFDIFQDEFPLLIKFIDTKDWLSVQVHPDDELAMERGLDRGKTEMWYIIDADKDTELISGFSKNISETEYKNRLADKTLPEILNYVETKKGDAFFIESKKIHALGPGLLLTEIQQASDTTYRIYDWDRENNTRFSRPLHIEQAMASINFKAENESKIIYRATKNEISPIVDSKYFTVNILNFTETFEKNYEDLDSFVIYILTEGKCVLKSHQGSMKLKIGDVVLLPAITKNIELQASEKCVLLETYIKM